MNSMARRMFELVEPIGVIPYSSDEPNEAMFALGFTNYWDTYFAGRAVPLGLVPAEVVDALFYNFAPGEVARHIPRVWRTTTPEAAIAAREVGCVKALRRILGDHLDAPAVARAADLLLTAVTERTGRGTADVRRAAHAADPRRRGGPTVPCRILCCASTAVTGTSPRSMTEGVGGLEAHVLVALDMDMPAAKFGRIHHLPGTQLNAVIDGMRARGLIADDGWLSEQGRACQAARRGPHRRPRGDALRVPPARRARRADGDARTAGRANWSPPKSGRAQDRRPVHDIVDALWSAQSTPVA